MLHLDNVTLISLAAINYESAVAALSISQDSIKFTDAKILAPTRPAHLPKNIRWEITPLLRLRSLGIDDYSHYFLYDIWKHVDTQFCLVVQGDGFVINPNSWTDEFLEYDYIGAPWPKKRGSYLDPFGVTQQVGNGGFSLRSKKLLEVPKVVDIPWNVNEGNFYNSSENFSLAEDGNISVHNKHIFESQGCRYPKVSLAVKFSQELPVPEARGVKPFGFHKYRPGASRMQVLRHIKAWGPNYLGLA